MHCDYVDNMVGKKHQIPPRNGYVFVEFFGSDQCATIRDTPDFVREFQMCTVDSVIKKNKKKRNEQVHNS